MKAHVKQAAIILLGFIVPLLVLAQAYGSLSTLGSSVNVQRSDDGIAKLFADARGRMQSANDYALFALIHAESANQRSMLNKQVMKVGIMQVGFAVISVGMMFIVLGIRDGSIEGGAEGAGLKMDIKTGSTGVMVFLVGAAMATAGGVLKNEYSTVPIMPFASVQTRLTADLVSKSYQACKDPGIAKHEECFLALVRDIEKGRAQ